MKNMKIFIPNIGDVNSSTDNTFIDSFNSFADITIDRGDSIVNIRVYAGATDFDVSHSGKGEHDAFANDGSFDFTDWPDVATFIDWAFTKCEII
jgi:hypothetical protein